MVFGELSIRPSVEARNQLVEDAMRHYSALGFVHQTAEDDHNDGRHVTLRGRRLVNFGSCSYLGLETDERVKQGACDAVRRFGTQFSSSRAYVSTALYAEFEALLEQIVRAPLVVTQTTSLGHLGVLPVLISENDAVLYDVLVHASVQAVLPTLRGAGIECKAVPHSHLHRLERALCELERTHERVWLLLDGVYSMHGDVAPLDELFELQARHPRLYLYIDDAHGVSWTGARGAGTVLGARAMRPRSVVALGLSKAFAASGAAFVFSDEATRDRVRHCASTLIFSGPLQPALLGAGIASAKIHLSDELVTLQRALLQRIGLFNELSLDAGLKIRGDSLTPIRFVEAGPEELATELAQSAFDAGYYANLSMFPAVPRRRAGMRVMLTTHQTEQDIVGLVTALAERQPHSHVR
ncbi:MAG TPA: aminotransferase class I/II-fold pyridoxal phosphate-dependent enzyme [Polyangiaceae bacterium]|jgi:7-keto-8-aminopelargonate synthetase-like enzyme